MPNNTTDEKHSNRFIFDGDEDELKHTLRSILHRYMPEYKIHLDNGKTKLIAYILYLIYLNKIHNDFDPEYHIEIIEPYCPPNIECKLIPKTRYFINIRKTLLILIAFLIDTLYTRGALLLTLTMLGYNEKTIHRLSNYEYTLLKIIEKIINNNSCVTQEEIIKELSNSFGNKKRIKNILRLLLNKGILEKKDNCIKITF